MTLTFFDFHAIIRSKKVKEVIWMNISELVARAIIDILEESDGTAEIQRNDLAQTMGCAPSQINYVITSRFTPEHGYTVESRRGGGGYIRITRVRHDKPAVLMHLVNCIGNELDSKTARAMISNLLMNGIISDEVCKVMLAACSENAYREVPSIYRDILRASVFKQMLINLE